MTDAREAAIAQEGPWTATMHCEKCEVASECPHGDYAGMCCGFGYGAHLDLIAAAPDLLAACEMFLENANLDAINESEEDNPYLHQMIAAAEAAIASARGEDVQS